MKHQSLAPLIEEAERAIKAAIAHFKLKIPADKIVLTVQSKGRKQAYGWFGPKRWQNGKKEAIHEINLSAEHLTDPRLSSGDTLLHELAHAENEFLGIKDCANRVHNKHFKSMAEKIGMDVEERDKKLGFYRTHLNKDGKAFLKRIAFKHQLFILFRVSPMGAAAKKGSRLVKITCGDCDYTARTTRKWLEVGLPTCPCGTEMEES